MLLLFWELLQTSNKDMCSLKQMSWRRQWQPTPILLLGKSQGQRSLVGCSPWGHEELNMTEQLHFHFSLSCIGEGDGNPLQCSCLENPRDGRAWWAAVYGVTQRWTRLKRLSSSSRSSKPIREGQWWVHTALVGTATLLSDVRSQRSPCSDGISNISVMQIWPSYGRRLIYIWKWLS